MAVVTSEPGLRRRSWWTSLILALGLAACGASLSLAWNARIVPTRIGEEQYFQSDLSRVRKVLTNRYNRNHERSRIHPLFSLVNTSAVYGIRRGLALDPDTAVRGWMAAWAAIWTVAFFFAARALGHDPLDALLLTALALSTSSAFCWLSVPETYAAGSSSMLLCVIVAGMSERRRLGDVPLTVVTATAMSMTITNVTAAVPLVWRLRGFRAALQIGVNAFVLVYALQVVQNVVYRESQYMFWNVTSEERFVMDRSAGSVADKLRVVFVHSIVMPRAGTPIEYDTKTPMASFQQSAIGSSGPLGLAATAAWLGILAYGTYCGWKRVRVSTAAFTLFGALALQVLLHGLYGDQTFLYALNFAPLLVLVSGEALAARRRNTMRILFASVIVVLALNNVVQLNELCRVLTTISAQGTHIPVGGF